MEKGTIKSYDQNCGVGIISRLEKADITFYADSIVGRERAALKSNDLIFFDVPDIKNLLIAVNIRKRL